jgi:ParB-like chromosome segregation protein Spo0J
MPAMIRYHEAVQDLMVSAEAIQPDPRNPNNGDIDAIIESITVNGVYRPVYAAKATGHIVAGHHLYAALLEMGAQRIPVQWVDGDLEQVTRILLADNQIAKLARQDDAQVIDLLQWLDATERGVLGTGFTDDSINDLRAMNAGGFALPNHQDPWPHECPGCGHTWIGPCRPEQEEQHDA